MQTKENIPISNEIIKEIKISVVIPTYNRVAYLERCISSVIKQSYKIDEIIVIDNNSDDNTAEFIKSKYPFIKLFNEEKEGVSFARNYGIKKAKNKWIAFLDSDDEWNKNKIEKQVEKILFSKSKYKIIHTNEKWIRNGKHLNKKKKHEKKEGYIFNDCLEICKISPSSVLIHKSLFLKYGYFDNDLVVCEDYDLWLRITSKVLVGYVDEPLLIKYGGHKGQLSKKYWGIDRFRVQALEKLILKFFLNSDQKYLAIKIIIKKLNILSKGAKNRGNNKMLISIKRKEKLWKHELYKHEKSSV